MIAIIDYGMREPCAVSRKAFEAVGHQAVVTREPRVIADASHVVLPAWGIRDCMANLERYELIGPIHAADSIRQTVLASARFINYSSRKVKNSGHTRFGNHSRRAKKFRWMFVKGAAYGLERYPIMRPGANICRDCTGSYLFRAFLLC